MVSNEGVEMLAEAGPGLSDPTTKALLLLPYLPLSNLPLQANLIMYMIFTSQTLAQSQHFSTVLFPILIVLCIFLPLCKS